MSEPHAGADHAHELIAFMLHDQEFCVHTTSIREIRGWAPVTPLPHCPYDVLGVINLRGTVIPIVDLAIKLGMGPAKPTQRSAIVVTSVEGRMIGLMVDRVSDILTIPNSELQPVPSGAGIASSGYAVGIFARDKQMICFLNLEAIFGGANVLDDVA